jgi:hypothetical protein
MAMIRQIPKAAAKCEGKPMDSIRKKLHDWAVSPRLERPYFFYSAPEEKEELKRFKALYPDLNINLSDFSKQADRVKKLGSSSSGPQLKNRLLHLLRRLAKMETPCHQRIRC